MAKPITFPLWATDQTNNDEPTAGQKATGWTPNQMGVSDYDNWWKYLTYAWIKYLDDLNIDADAFTFFPDSFVNVGAMWTITGSPTSADPTLTLALESTGAGNVDICLSNYMRDGQVLQDVRVWLFGDNTVDVVGTVYKHDFSLATSTAVGTATATNVSNASITFLDIAAVNITAGQLTSRIWLRLNASAAAAKALAVILEFAPIP